MSELKRPTLAARILEIAEAAAMAVFILFGAKAGQSAGALYGPAGFFATAAAFAAAGAFVLWSWARREGLRQYRLLNVALGITFLLFALDFLDKAVGFLPRATGGAF